MIIGKTTTQANPDACPRCGKDVDQHTGVSGNDSPSEGDLSICMHCLGMLRFGEALRLYPLSDEEFVELPDDVRRDLLRAQTLLRRSKLVGKEEG